MKNAFGLICFQPKEIWCNFLNNFTEYSVFLIVDDNNFDLNDFEKLYKNISFIKIDSSKCELNGFIYLNYSESECSKKIIAWEKALYYFSVENNLYNNVWLLEDDVFFHDENTLINIDNKFPLDDLLSNHFHENSCEKIDYWYHWGRFKIEFPLPHYRGMMCAVRLSKNLINKIKEYAKQYNTLFFLEALFPTITIKNNLKFNNPEELKEIKWNCGFEKKDIIKTNLYHPVKNLENHIIFRIV
jgi:hypothetical protein